MAGVDVSIETLKELKKSFSDFRNDIEKPTRNINNSLLDASREISRALKKQEGKVYTLQNKCKELESQIEQTKMAVKKNCAVIESLKRKIDVAEQQKLQLEIAVQRLEKAKNDLARQGRGSDDDAVQRIEEQIRELRANIAKLNEQINKDKSTISSIERKNSELRSLLARKEEELRQKKDELGRETGKLQRMKNAADIAKNKSSGLELALNKFENTAINVSYGGTTSLEKCIDALQQYIDTYYV